MFLATGLKPGIETIPGKEGGEPDGRRWALGPCKPPAASAHRLVAECHLCPKSGRKCWHPGPRLPDWAAPSCQVCSCSEILSGSYTNWFILQERSYRNKSWHYFCLDYLVFKILSTSESCFTGDFKKFSWLWVWVSRPTALKINSSTMSLNL